LKMNRLGISERLYFFSRAVLAPAMILQFLHRGDIFTGEDSKLRLGVLKVYARYEVALMKFTYWLLNKPMVRQSKFVRRFLYFTMAKFMGERFIVGECMTWSEVESFVADLPLDSAIAVGPCRCRLATGVCDHPLETDIVILTGAPIWTSLFPDDYRLISKSEAMDIMRECRELGMVQSVFRNMYFRGSSNYFVICNCCKCSCNPIIGYRVFKEDGFSYILSKSVSEVNPELCKGCGTCVERCPFEERVLMGGKAVVGNCMGCEVCVRFCPEGASRMTPREETLSRVC
jgi:ferredoxin